MVLGARRARSLRDRGHAGAGPLTAELIVALDVPDAKGAIPLVQSLGEECSFYKVGSELFTASGPGVVAALRTAGKDVFLDLKFHDIPNTVRSAARSAAKLGVRLLTVHAAGGLSMLEAAREGAGEHTGVLAVTVLTSLDASTLGGAWGRSVEDVRAEVLRLSDLAREAGLHGIVCGGEDAPLVRARHGDALALLVPGIRLEGDAVHDQARVTTPSGAVRAGARYLVLGRTVSASADPAAALRAVRAEIEA
jgi:orotidine-5'-phosphate decarboxylase